MKTIEDDYEPYAAVDKIEYWRNRCEAAEKLLEAMSNLDIKYPTKDDKWRIGFVETVNAWEKSKKPY